MEDMSKMDTQDIINAIDWIMREWFEADNWWPQFEACVNALGIICDWEGEGWMQSEFLIELSNFIKDYTDEYREEMI